MELPVSYISGSVASAFRTSALQQRSLRMLWSPDHLPLTVLELVIRNL